MSKLSLFDAGLSDDGPPKGWTEPLFPDAAPKRRRRKAAAKKRKSATPDAPNVFPWEVRLYMNDGSFRRHNIGKLTYVEAAKERDDHLAGADAYKAWLDRAIA